MHGDGNCLFRAIAFAVSNPDLGHAELRRKVCDTESTDSDLKEALGDSMDDFNERLANMRKLGEWGGEPELLTASRVVHRRIFVWTNGACLAPYGESDHPAIHLSYENNNHYNLFMVDPRIVSQSQPSVSVGEPCVVGQISEAAKCSLKGRIARPKKRSTISINVARKKAKANISEQVVISPPECSVPVPETDCNHHEKRLRSAIEDTPRETVSSVAASKARGGRPKKKRLRQPPKRRTGVDIDVPEATDEAQQNDGELVMHAEAAISVHVVHPQVGAAESRSAAGVLSDDGRQVVTSAPECSVPVPETDCNHHEKRLRSAIEDTSRETVSSVAVSKVRGGRPKKKGLRQPPKRRTGVDINVPEATNEAQQNDGELVMHAEAAIAGHVDHPQVGAAESRSAAGVLPDDGRQVMTSAPECNVPVLETDCNYHEKRLRSAIEDTSREIVSSIAVSKARGGRPKKKGLRQPAKHQNCEHNDVPQVQRSRTTFDRRLSPNVTPLPTLNLAV